MLVDILQFNRGLQARVDHDFKGVCGAFRVLQQHRLAQHAEPLVRVGHERKARRGRLSSAEMPDFAFDCVHVGGVGHLQHFIEDVLERRRHHPCDCRAHLNIYTTRKQ